MPIAKYFHIFRRRRPPRQTLCTMGLGILLCGFSTYFWIKIFKTEISRHVKQVIKYNILRTYWASIICEKIHILSYCNGLLNWLQKWEIFQRLLTTNIVKTKPEDQGIEYAQYFKTLHHHARRLRCFVLEHSSVFRTKHMRLLVLYTLYKALNE